MTIILRLAVDADIPRMQFVRNCVRENRLSDPVLVPDSAYRPFIDVGGIWVAEAKSVMAGFAALDGRSASVWALFVAPAFEGRGIGRILHQRLLDHAAMLGISRLSLTTQPDSRAARFYVRSGWQSSGYCADGQERFEKILS
jgi:GNAT superfamily N-acetyltransferase